MFQQRELVRGYPEARTRSRRAFIGGSAKESNVGLVCLKMPNQFTGHQTVGIEPVQKVERAVRIQGSPSLAFEPGR